jgi:CheY-like chemotaxis protein
VSDAGSFLGARASRRTDRPDKELGSLQSSASEPIEPQTVLLVEGDNAALALVYRFLEDGGYNVLAASNGDEALFICRQFRHPIALLLTDVDTPGMSGFDLAEHASGLHPLIKFLFISRDSENSSSRRTRPAANTTFLAKPFSGTTLMRKVKEALWS